MRVAIYQHHKSYQMRLLKKERGLITWFENLDPAMPEPTTATPCTVALVSSMYLSYFVLISLPPK